MSTTKLRRSAEQRWIGGVCGGIAEYTGADVTVVRLIIVAATLLGLGSLILFYLVAWIFIPDARSS
ncbi:PspC domain-containing protein [Aeromicrobium sp. CTD01-1L150]|uniref:PspC domain-containing protein n=1 Tax=Aeromicrobium sp. CTD01-1L150 TaxID=3341830 RepID=UPI0035C24FB4